MPTLDEQLRDVLSLGNGKGCHPRIPASGPGSDKIGNELKAICGPSAVSSASSLGGGINTLQGSTIVSQFDTSSTRLDRRLGVRTAPPPNSGPRPSNRSAFGAVQYALLQTDSISDAPQAYPGEIDQPAYGFGVFGDLTFEQRERESSARETGYELEGLQGLLGVDWGDEQQAGGIWVSYSEDDGEYLAGAPLVVAPTLTGAPAVAPQTQALLNDRDVLSGVCGGAIGQGQLSANETGVGGFYGHRIGEAAFADVQIKYTRRNNNYQRDACAIELPISLAPLSFDSQKNLLFIDDSGDRSAQDNESITDDVFAGRISGANTTEEFGAAVRVGYDIAIGDLVIGPRASFTYLKTQIGGYEETGVNSLTSTTVVIPNDSTLGVRNDCLTVTPVDPTRCIGAVFIQKGAPTGLELAYADRTFESKRIEIGAELFYNFELGGAAIVPFVSGYFLHEFEDGIQSASARMAQDQRGTDAYWFQFGYDALTTDSAIFSAGVSAQVNDTIHARFEVSQLAFDDLVKTTSVTAQLRLVF